MAPQIRFRKRCRSDRIDAAPTDWQGTMPRLDRMKVEFRAQNRPEIAKVKNFSSGLTSSLPRFVKGAR
jgi:hypothetical protein